MLACGQPQLNLKQFVAMQYEGISLIFVDSAMKCRSKILIFEGNLYFI